MKLTEMYVLASMFGQVLASKITKRPRPVSVNLQVTKFCNLKCPYCFADLGSLAEIKELSTKEIFETINELRKYGCRHIILMGGEPLMRKDIGEIIRYIKGKRMRCEIVTNGFFVDRYIQALKLCDSVCISLDGPKEPNDRLRGDGCHDRVLNAMEILSDNKIKARIHAILTRYNLESGLPYIAETAKKFGFVFNFSMVMLRQDIRPDFINFTEEEIVRFLNDYRRYRDNGYPVFTSNTCFDYMLNWPKKGDYTIFRDDDLTPAQWKWVMPCNYGRYNAFVDVDGRGFKCCLTWKNGLNWREKGMRQAIDHVGKNLINCVSCRSIGDIDRALLLSFKRFDIMRMAYDYISGKRN